MKLFCAVLLSLLISGSVHAQIDLSLDLETGRTYLLSASEKTTIIETQYGTDVKNVTSTAIELSLKFLQKIDTAYLMEVRFISMNHRLEGPQGVTINSSALTDSSGFVSKMLNKVMQKPFRVVMDKNYNWKEVHGLDDIFREALACCATSEEASRKIDSVLAAEMKNFLTEGSNPLVNTLPPARLKPGEVWAVHQVSDRVIPTNDSCGYLVEIYGDDLLVKGAGSSKSVEKETLRNGNLVSFFLDGDIHYTARFDRQTKWIKQATIKTTLTGHAISKKEGSILKQKIPMTVITESLVSGF